MVRLNLRNKLLSAILVVLLPMLALIVYDHSVEYAQQTDAILEEQLRTSQAIAALVDASIDDAFSTAWTISRDPLVETLDRSRIEPHLLELAISLPQLDDVAVFDAEGANMGSMALYRSGDPARPSAGDREYFEELKTSAGPVVSDVIISRATGKPTVVVAVPMADESGILRGVTIAALDLDYLAERLSTVGLRSSQAILVTDRQGTVAFHTLLPREEWGRRDFSAHPTVASALGGAAVRERGVMTPLGDERIIAAVPTPRYGWVASVSVSSEKVLGPVHTSLIANLLAFSAVLLLAGLGAVLLSRRMILRPLELLTHHLEAFGSGQWGRRIELRTGDEMEQVGRTFNRMAAQLEEWSQERERLLRETLEARQELEEARQRRERFVSMVAHELRSPLTVVIGYGQLLAARTREGKEVDPRQVDGLLGQARRLKRLVEDLSDVSLIETGRFGVTKAPCDLGKLAHEVVEQQQMMAPKHRIVLDAPEERLVGEWDCERLLQVLGNLVGNAVKYSPGGGRVAVALVAGDSQVMVSVADEGIGMAAEEIPQLFQPFSKLYRDRPIRGTGLGLYITRAIVEAHGGRIWAESEAGKGSLFGFTLPLSNDREVLNAGPAMASSRDL